MNKVGLKKSTSLRLDRELSSHEPNEETKKATAEARKERPFLKRFDNTKDLLDDLMAD